jgi:hypothetical protein
VAALCLFLLVSACGLGETSPSVVEQTQDGVTALVRNDVCGSAWKRDPGSGVIGVEKGPLIPVV